MWHKAIWKGHPMRLELTRIGLLVELANHYTTRGALCIRSSAVGYEMLVSWSGSGGWWVRNLVAKNNYWFETHSSKLGDELSLGQTSPCLNKRFAHKISFDYSIFHYIYLTLSFFFYLNTHKCKVNNGLWYLPKVITASFLFLSI